MGLFTPRTLAGNPWGAPEREPGRITLRLLDGDSWDVLGDDWREVATDHGPMLARRADCGADCACDAVVVPIGTTVAERARLDRAQATR